MAPPQHKVDSTLQAMERAHRASPDEQVRAYSNTINAARRDFESFASAEETASRQNERAGGSLLALVENERELDKDLDRSLERVKESLAEMERKRMLALGAMTRLSPEEALTELAKVKEHILSLSLRVPIRADFIVHGHNISLSIFRLFEAAERAEAEVDALINAKRSLDGRGEDQSAQDPSELLRNRPETATELEALSRDTFTQSVHPPHSSPSSLADEHSESTSRVNDPSPSEYYSSTEVDLGPLDSDEMKPAEELRLSENPRRPQASRAPTTTGLRLRQALKRSSQTATRSITEARSSQFPSEQNVEARLSDSDEQVFQGGDEEFDL